MNADRTKGLSFWNRYAKLYDFEINHTSKAAYNEIYRLISSKLESDMDVLELATGTGLISIKIAPYVRSVVATDYSQKMIEAAKKKKRPDNLHFILQDATALTFDDNSFDAVIISNALHIVPDPKKVTQNIKRVLKPGGLLIAPNFTHANLKESTFNAKLLKLIGFEVYTKWTAQEYVDFINQEGFDIEHWQILDAAFPLVYLQACKSE